MTDPRLSTGSAVDLLANAIYSADGLYLSPAQSRRAAETAIRFLGVAQAEKDPEEVAADSNFLADEWWAAGYDKGVEDGLARGRAEVFGAGVPDVAYTAKEPDLERFCIAFTWAYGTAIERKHLHKEPDDGMTPETLWSSSDEDSREFMRSVVRDTFAAYSIPSTDDGSAA